MRVDQIERSAPSASIVDVEKLVSVSACEPKATTPIESLGGFEVTNASAAWLASRSDRPAIERERSIASTTLFERPRFEAWRLPAGRPSSHTRGCAADGVLVTTEAVIVG